MCVIGCVVVDVDSTVGAHVDVVFGDGGCVAVIDVDVVIVDGGDDIVSGAVV